MISGTTEHRGVAYKYSIDLNEEDLVKYYVNKLVLDWCKTKHPEIFIKAEECVSLALQNKDPGSIIDEKA